MDALGASTLGVLAAPFVSDKSIVARDHLKTINAQVALDGSQQMKGSSSDKDTSLMRLAGVNEYKTVAENKRIINKAMVDAGLEQVRARLKSFWISKYGSIGNVSRSGMTFEEALSQAERRYRDDLSSDPRFAKAAGGTPRLRPAPPSTRKAAPTAKRPVYDLDGNRIQ